MYDYLRVFCMAYIYMPVIDILEENQKELCCCSSEGFSSVVSDFNSYHECSAASFYWPFCLLCMYCFKFPITQIYIMPCFFHFST